MFFRIKLPYLPACRDRRSSRTLSRTSTTSTLFTCDPGRVYHEQPASWPSPTPKEVDLLVTWLFRLTQEYYNYKMAAVLGIMVFIVCAVFTVVCFHFINKKEARSLEYHYHQRCRRAKQLKQGRVKKTVFSIIRHLILALLACIWLLPIACTAADLVTPPIRGIHFTRFVPESFTLWNYISIMTEPDSCCTVPALVHEHLGCGML